MPGGTPGAVLPTSLPSIPAAATTPAAPAPSTAATTGALVTLAFGDGGFKRACMKGCGDGDLGYTYLIEQIQPTGGQKAGILAVGLLFALMVWGALLAVGIPSPSDLRTGTFRATRDRQSRNRAHWARGYRNSSEFDRLLRDMRAHAAADLRYLRVLTGGKKGRRRV